MYNRILLKLSGEALMGTKGYGIDSNRINNYALEIKNLHENKIQIAIVIGGGNIFRGVSGSSEGVDRVQADYMGMLATCINCLAMQDAIEKLGGETRVQTAIEMAEIAEPYIRRKAVRHLEKNRIVIFGAGTGNPYFTTDTAASLRAMEIDAEIIMKATKVDGVYDKDPMQYEDAVKYDQLSFIEVLNKQLKVMDSTAISLCMENDLPILTFNLNKEGNIKKAILGEKVGTIIKGEDS